MPKLKSKKSAVKRFRKTASGKFKHRCSFRSHLLIKKSAKRKHHLSSTAIVNPSDSNAINELLK